MKRKSQDARAREWADAAASLVTHLAMVAMAAAEARRQNGSYEAACIMLTRGTISTQSSAQNRPFHREAAHAGEST